LFKKKKNFWKGPSPKGGGVTLKNAFGKKKKTPPFQKLAKKQQGGRTRGGGFPQKFWL